MNQGKRGDGVLDLTRSRLLLGVVAAAAAMAADAAPTIDDDAIAAFDRSARGGRRGVEDEAVFHSYELELQGLLSRAQRRGDGARADWTATPPAGRSAVAVMTLPAGPSARMAVPPVGSTISRTSGDAGPARGRDLAVRGADAPSLGAATRFDPGRSRSSAETIAGAGVTAPGSTTTTTCSLFQPGADRVAAGDCMSCHGLTQTHPVEIDYAAAAARRPEFYRTPAEATRRGAFMPDGQVKCVTCHDPLSPWKDKIALPPGAQPTPAVDLTNPRTFESRRALEAANTTLPPNSAVSPTPLCRLCHTYGD